MGYWLKVELDVILMSHRRIVMQASLNFYFMRFSKCIVNSINTIYYYLHIIPAFSYNSKNKAVHGYHYRIDFKY